MLRIGLYRFHRHIARLISETDTELVMVIPTFDLCPHTLTTLRPDEIALCEP